MWERKGLNYVPMIQFDLIVTLCILQRNKNFMIKGF